MSNALKRILRDQAGLREEEESEEGWFALPMQDDPEVNWMNFEVDICGPENYKVNPVPGASETRPSPYREGMFKIQVALENTYPQTAPKIRFMTKCWHPNISYEDGKVCADFLTEIWKPTMGLRDVLITVRDLLAQPNATDNVNQEAAAAYQNSIDEFDKKAASETSKYASS